MIPCFHLCLIFCETYTIYVLLIHPDSTELETVTYRQLREMDKAKGVHRPNDGDFEMALLSAIEQLEDLKVDTRYALSLNRSFYPEDIPSPNIRKLPFICNLSEFSSNGCL